MAKDQKTSSIATKSSKEWITLRPTLWGMSIDLKEAWYRLREWWQSPDKKEYPDSGERADNPEPEVGREINASVERIPNEGNAVRQADRIRQFAFDQYIAPARAESRGEVTVRAGDVHREMGLTSAMPAVCSAISGRRFQELANVTLTKREGPPNGANVYFYFKLR